MTPTVVCVVPAFNAEATLPAVSAGLRRSLPHAVVLAVDDGSADATSDAARGCCDVVIRFEHNRGKGAALRAGIDEALARGAEIVLTIDADGQHDPACAPLLVAALNGADLAIGARARRGTMPLGRRLTNRLASAAVGAITGATVIDAQSGFRALRRDVLLAVHATGDRYEYETDFLIRALRAGFRVTAVPVPTVYGAPSHFRGLRDSARVVRAIWRHRTGTRL